MNELLNTILKDTYSLTQLKHRLSVLKNYLLQNLFGGQTATGLEEKDSAWLKSLSPALLQNFNKDNLNDTFARLEQEISKLKILTIYLAFDPDEASLIELGAMARKMFDPTLLLDIKVDPRLIAGAALVWKGIYRDYSLRARLLERRAEILDSFKGFLR